MEFEINGRKWEIIETNQQKMNEVEKTTEESGYKYFGICCYEEQKIYLWENLHQEQKKATLIHELVHCYMGVYCSFEDVTWNTDLVCNICANSHDIIHNIVEKYFNQKKELIYGVDYV